MSQGLLVLLKKYSKGHKDNGQNIYVYVIYVYIEYIYIYTVHILYIYIYTYTVNIFGIKVLSETRTLGPS